MVHAQVQGLHPCIQLQYQRKCFYRYEESKSETPSECVRFDKISPLSTKKNMDKVQCYLSFELLIPKYMYTVVLQKNVEYTQYVLILIYYVLHLSGYMS